MTPKEVSVVRKAVNRLHRGILKPFWIRGLRCQFRQWDMDLNLQIDDVVCLIEGPVTAQVVEDLLNLRLAMEVMRS